MLIALILFLNTWSKFRLFKTPGVHQLPPRRSGCIPRTFFCLGRLYYYSLGCYYLPGTFYYVRDIDIIIFGNFLKTLESAWVQSLGASFGRGGLFCLVCNSSQFKGFSLPNHTDASDHLFFLVQCQLLLSLTF
jgi:hypothetical protein